MTEFVATAFLRQARADYRSFLVLRDQKEPPSQWLHFLQMAIEKTGKVYVAHGLGARDVNDVPQTHQAFARFVQKLPRFQKSVLPALDIKHVKQLKEHVKSVVVFAEQLEALQPQIARGGPNVEYPWNIPGGLGVGVPCEHAFDSITSTLNQARGRGVLKIVEVALNALPAREGIPE